MKTRLPDWSQSLIFSDWPAPQRVRAVTTTRLGGVSPPPFASFNLADHVADDPAHVASNRQRLARMLRLPAEPLWLNQVHGREVIAAECVTASVEADAAFTRQPDRICVVLTADCLPVLLCDRAGTGVAIAHAGWRGLAAGVLSAVVARLSCDPAQLLAWLGPAIGPAAFEVGDELRRTFVNLDPANALCFKPSVAGRWLADIYALARHQLQTLGILSIYGGSWCTFTDAARFFSHRRDGHTGRMASLIWLSAE